MGCFATTAIAVFVLVATRTHGWCVVARGKEIPIVGVFDYWCAEDVAYGSWGMVADANLSGRINDEERFCGGASVANVYPFIFVRGLDAAPWNFDANVALTMSVA